jgi:hypothetical protein
MGDRKPKKPSSGNSDAHKAKAAKVLAQQPVIPTPVVDKGKTKKK